MNSQPINVINNHDIISFALIYTLITITKIGVLKSCFNRLARVTKKLVSEFPLSQVKMTQESQNQNYDRCLPTRWKFGERILIDKLASLTFPTFSRNIKLHIYCPVVETQNVLCK